MVKWDDKHMYNWIGWMRSLLAMRENINEWTVSPKKAYKFPMFMANNLIISPLVLLALILMTIPQTIEWLMANIMSWVNQQLHTDALDSAKGFPVVMVIIFLIPYLLTWGLPKLIREMKQERVEERLRKQAEELRQVEEDSRQWDHRVAVELQRQIHDALDRRKTWEDFRPKKIIKHHQFGDTPKIRIFTRDEQPIRRTPSRRDRTIRRVRILE